ncbi:MAG TPA: glutamine-hydrolyzing GMP synthase [Thermoprotei archaeon]|nr:glutamine-hydrolyzing GMP synthase [Thermoprotei archaeon]
MRAGWTPSLKHDTVAVVNFGGQYAHLIARRIRELGVYSELVDYEQVCEDYMRRVRLKAVVLSGSPMSASSANYSVVSEILKLGVPVLGICYGHQLLATALGGRTEKGVGEYGRTRIRILTKDTLFEGWNSEEDVWMSHRDYVSSLPSSAKVLALSENNVIAAFKLKDKPVYGVQFHPEVSHTPKGSLLLSNFLFKIAGCEPSWRPGDVIEELIAEVRRKTSGEGKVLCAVSGGVDSTVTAVIVKRAVGERLLAVFVDHGLLREGEVEETLAMFKNIGLNVVFIDAKERFLRKLRGVKNSEEKRRIIGEEFALIFKEIVEKDPSIKWLAQGTIYPDVIESGREKHSAKIKSHHNVACLPEWLGLKVVEPLKYFYKDEVRKIGEKLGLPKTLLRKHPFPGPGLAVRIIGEVTEEKLKIVRRASKIVEEELQGAGLYEKVWQGFAVVSDSKWVGVKGDSREEGYIVIVRVVESSDGMTADYVRLPYEVLDRIASRIYKEIEKVTMVTYATTPKPPSTIEPC